MKKSNKKYLRLECSNISEPGKFTTVMICNIYIHICIHTHTHTHTYVCASGARK